MPYFGKEPNTSATSKIGAGVAEDIKLVFDGNAQDFHIGLDDTADDLVIGLGSTLGTTTHMSFDENGVISLPLQPSCSVHLSGAQEIAHATETKITWQTELYDLNNDLDNSTNYRFTAPVDGIYLCTAMFSMNMPDEEYLAMNIVKNSTDMAVNNNASSVANHTTTEMTYILKLDADDFVFVEAYQVQGAAENITANAFYSSFQVHKLA